MSMTMQSSSDYFYNNNNNNNTNYQQHPNSNSSMISDDDLLLADLDSFQLESTRDKQLSAMASLLKGVLPDAPAHAHDHHYVPPTNTQQQQAPLASMWPRQNWNNMGTVGLSRPGPPAPSSSYVGSPSWTSSGASQQQGGGGGGGNFVTMGGLTPYGTPMTGSNLPLPNGDQNYSTGEGVTGGGEYTHLPPPQPQTRYSLRSSTRQQPQQQLTHEFTTSSSSSRNHQDAPPPPVFQTGLRAPCVSRERECFNNDNSRSSSSGRGRVEGGIGQEIDFRRRSDSITPTSHQHAGGLGGGGRRSRRGSQVDVMME